MFTPHRHNEVELNFVTYGAMTYWLGGERVPMLLRQLIVFWGAIPHQLIEVSPDTSLYWLTLPLNQFLGWNLPAPFVKALLEGKCFIESDPSLSEWDGRLIQRWHDDHQRGQTHEAVMLKELEARLARLALSVGKTPSLIDEPHRIEKHPTNTHAETMARWIAEHYHEQIDVQAVADAVGLHPNYAMRIFQQAFGQSMIDMLTQHRVAHAQRLLITSDKSVLEIALEVGFGSLSRFYSVFKGRCGVSPKVYRQSIG